MRTPRFVDACLAAFLILLLILMETSCGGMGGATTASAAPTATVTPPAPAPAVAPTVVFTASPTTIQPGQSTTLTWQTQNATSATLQSSTVNLSGTMQMSPAATTTYVLSATGPGGAQQASVTVTVAPATIQHVAIVLLENKNYSQVIGSSSMPYLNSLATQYAVAQNYFANGTESLPNYFMLTVGDTVTTTAGYTGPYTGDNIVRELVKAGKTWKAYAQSLPSAGYLGDNAYPYEKVHNPFAYFSDVVNDSTQAQNIVPFTQLATDISAGKLPNYIFIIPDNQTNTHDCPPNMSSCTLSDTLSYCDKWLKANIDPLLQTSTFQNSGILVITFDESYDSTVNGGGHVPTVVAGAKVKNGYGTMTFFQHQSTLRMMMKALGFTTYIGAAANAPDMDEMFSSTIP
ncbi:MAG: alkaline phosphatase family protein [Terriglobales bacterium]